MHVFAHLAAAPIWFQIQHVQLFCVKKQKRTLVYILFLWGAVARQQKPAQHWPVRPVKKALPGVVAMGKGLGSPENGEFVSWDSLVTC